MNWSRQHMCGVRRATGLLGVLLLLGIMTGSAQAQISPPLAPQKATRQLDLVISWRGYSFVPTTYEGRVLSSGGAPVMAQLQAFADGRPVSLSGYDIEWRSNGIPYLRGENKTEFRFVTESYPPPFYIVSVTVREGRLVAGTAAVEIPVAARPKVVINIPYPKKAVPKKDVALQALPYFFSAKNLTDLTFSWSVAGVPIALENLFSNFASFSFDGSRDRIAATATVRNNVVSEEQVTATTYVDVQ